MDSLFNEYDEFYRGVKGKDKLIVERILNEVKKYDVYDIIEKLSALNLIPENQNKATIIEPIIAAILTLPKSELTSEYKISIGKLKKIVRLIEDMQLVSAIDPPENPYIDRVLFYNNYNIFTGINYIPGFILQGFINTIYIKNNDFNIEFTKKTAELIRFILEVSDYLSKKIGISFENIRKYEEVSNIVIPNENELEQLKSYVVFKEDIISGRLNDSEILYSDFENDDVENVLNTESQKFFNGPFLRDNKGNVIVLSPSILVPFLIHSILNLANKYGEREKLIQLYNETVWRQCTEYFYKMDNKKIKEASLDIELKEDETSYKEMLLSGDNKQVIIVVGIFDDGRNFDEEKLFGRYKNNSISKLLDDRIKYISKKLREKIEDQDIFLCLIYNSFGRSIMIGFNGFISNKPICLNPFELRCIAINERKEKFFITRYILSKNKLAKMPQAFGELPYINTYTNNDYSFYINDDFNPKKMMLYISPGDEIEYIIKALKKEDRQLVESYKPQYLEEVILQDKERKIYVSDKIDKKNIVLSLLVKMKNIEIWIYSENVKNSYELNIYHSVIDTISYWLGECRSIIEKKDNIQRHKSIKITITGECLEYFYDKPAHNSIEDTISIKKENDSIKINISPDTYYCFNRQDNIEEKKLLKMILEIIFKITDEDKNKIEEIFTPDKKQKFFSLNYEKYPYMKPITFPQNRKISENDVNELLDEVGSYILSLNRWNYGVVPEEEKNEITRLVVDYLYTELQKRIKKLNPCNLIEIVYSDLEEQMYNMMLFQKRQYNDVLCYPEKKSEIWKDFNDKQRALKAMKFFIEYTTAQPPSGNEILGEYEYEQLLAICSLIIEWAYNNDLFYYKIFSTPVEILKSDRIGLKKDEYDVMSNCLVDARKNEFEYNSIGRWNEFIVENKIDENELDDAFFSENGFTFSELLNVCFKLILIGDGQKGEVKKISCNKLNLKLQEQLKDFEEIKIKAILAYISMEKRKDFIIPPDGYRREDIYPWRFNRRLSFTRRPLIKRDNEYIWGNRNIFHMAMFTMDLIKDGKYTTKSKKMNKYIGELSYTRGMNFNESIFNILKTFPELIVDKNLKTINGNKIVDENNDDLGDIDIIYIHSKSKKIVVGEVKDFKLSRNPYEIYMEYKEMFEDTEQKRSFSTKLKRRMDWVKRNINDVKVQYGLSGEGWEVYRTFIVNEHLVSKNVYGKNENIIAISEISLDTLIDLNLI